MMTRRRLLGGGAALFAIAIASPAAAGDREAERLFDEARVLAEAGRWVEACPRLAESFRLEPNMTTEFRLADCYEHTGRVASAWSHYVGASKAAATAGEPVKERFAADRAAKLEPRVDKLVIAPTDEPDLKIERDGRLIPSELWNTPQPVDPGEHTVHAWAPGKTSFDLVIVTKGTGETRRIDVPLLEPAIPWRLSGEAQPRPFADPAPAVAAAADTTPAPRVASPWRTVGWALGGVGIATVGVGAGLYVDRATRTDACAGSSCAPSVIVLGVGTLVVVAGALVLLATDH